MEFEQFVREQQGPLRRFLLNLSGGNRALSDDLAQEAFLKAWVALPGFSRRSKMSTWLFKIAYNCWLDYCKQSARHGLHCTACDERIAADATDGDGAVYDRQLYQALGQLPEIYRVPILLHYMEQKSVREIAEVIGADRGAVKMRLSRGRTQLREILLTLGYER